MQGFLYFCFKIPALMIRYNSIKQLSIEEFRTPFQMQLDKNNRWVQLAQLIPWDEMAAVYHSKLSSDNGAPAIDARIVIGAMIIKHKMKLDDRETIEQIRENMYVQYFLGLSGYTYQEVFDRSLFTSLRYRLGEQEFDCLNGIIIEKAERIEKAVSKTSVKKKPLSNSEEDLSSAKEEGSEQEKGEKQKKEQPPCETEQKQLEANMTNKGKLQLDATVADQMIVYPTDLGLLNTCREESERLIDELHKVTGAKKKPRTYRKKARKQYLRIAKKKKKTKQEIRKGICQQLRYLKRNLSSIHKQLDVKESLGNHGEQQQWPLDKRDQKIFWVIQHIYVQQLEMYQNKVHSVADRIVNIYQPYVRPIVRGKEKTNVEFGAKLGVSLQNGFARINTFSWNAYNESTDLKKQVEDYKSLYGYYPEAVLSDTIYGTRENRAFLKERNIRFVGKSLGRSSQIPMPYYQKRKQQKERNERNHIEGKFGQGKNGYNLSKIRARKQKTSESWVSCIFFVMNLVALMKLAGKTRIDFLFASYFLAPLEIFWRILLDLTQEKSQYQPVQICTFSPNPN